jgi:hypothetical protein
MSVHSIRPHTKTATRTVAAERIELGTRVCDAMAAESLPLRVGLQGRLGATLAAFAAVCQRGDQARRRAAIAHFAHELRQRAS